MVLFAWELGVIYLVGRRCGVGEECWVCWCVRVCVMLWALSRVHKNGCLVSGVRLGNSNRSP